MPNSVLRFTFSLFLILMIAIPGQAKTTETYFKFTIESRAELNSLTRIISIDNVKGDTVYAYANPSERAAFESLDIAYTVLPHPGSLVKPSMATTASGMTAWDSYPSYETYVAMMNDFETSYPGLCRIETIGNSVQGRQLLVAKLSANVDTEENEPEVFYTSTMHGDETAGYVLMLRLIDSLLTSYGIDPNVTGMLDSMEIWINPLANPDGTYITGNSSVSGAQRYNANGYDLNRNFPDPDEGDYPSGTRQTETQAMIDFAAAHRFIISANFHGGIEVINYPWDTWYRRHPDDIWFIDICRQYADSAQAHSPSGYMTALDNGITNGWDWYPVAGGRQDGMSFWYGCREATIELSRVKLLASSKLPDHWVYNRVALLDYLRQSLLGIRGLVTDASTGLPVAATLSVISHDADSSEVYTDPEVGDYHRMIESGTFDLLFTADDYFSTTIENVVVTAGNVTIANVQMVALVNGSDTDGDGVYDQFDNCVDVANPDQSDFDNNGAGDACDYICGDVDSSGELPDIVDLTYIVDFLFGGKAAPPNRYSADLDGSGGLADIVDLTMMVDYLFGPGITPTCGQ